MKYKQRVVAKKHRLKAKHEKEKRLNSKSAEKKS